MAEISEPKKLRFLLLNFNKNKLMEHFARLVHFLPQISAGRIQGKLFSKLFHLVCKDTVMCV